MSTKQKGFTVINNDVIDDDRLSSNEYKLYCIWERMTNLNNPTCWGSNRFYAEKLGVSVRSIQRFKKRLIELGYIKITHRKGITSLIEPLKKIILKAKEVTAPVFQGVSNSFNKNAKKLVDKAKKELLKTNFNSYDQRPYSDEYYKNLENSLLGWDK